MTTLTLIDANLTYGRNKYPVIKSDIAPLPDFDFADIYDSVFKTLAVMSNQSGGHRLTNPVVAITADRSYASLRGNGFIVRWGVEPVAPVGATIDELIDWSKRVLETMETIELPWGVRADQYGEGWKRAVKVGLTPDESGDMLKRWRK